MSSEGPPKRERGVAGAPLLAVDVVPIETVSHPLAQDFVILWQARQEAGQPLTRVDVPSRPLLRFMPYLILFEPLDAGRDWRFRLVGSQIGQRFGRDPTGMTLRGVYSPDQAAQQSAIYLRLSQATAPHLTRGRLLGIDRDYMDIEFCNMPLTGRKPGEYFLLTGVFPPP